MISNELKGNAQLLGDLLAPPRDQGGGATEKKSPRPHQKKAVNDLVNALSASGSDVRTQCHMACGTGKTMVALWVAEKLQSQKTLLAEPSLALIAQNLKEWQANARGPRPEILVVCSDQTVVRPNQDEIKVDLRDIPARVTSNPEEIARFLKNKSERKIIMSTYHSLPLLGKAMETRGTGRFDIAIADEAHRTAAKTDGAFTLFHYQEVIRSRTRLYQTATPKIYVGDSEVKISMDDESIFGKVGHSLSFSKAIAKGLLADYQLVVATLPENYLGKIKGQLTQEVRDTIAQLAVLRAIEKFHLSKVLSFHSSVKRAYDFAGSLELNGPKYLPDRSIWVHAVDGKMPMSTRSNLLKVLAERPKKALSLISNCRCLTEGIDVPAIDGVVFFDRKNDGVDVVQAIGRAIRQSTATNKKFGTIVVPLVVADEKDGAELLNATEFSKIGQIMRALRAHDDRLEIRLKDALTKPGNGRGGRGVKNVGIHFNIEELPESVRGKLSTKILRIGSGINGSILTESLVLKWADYHYKTKGVYPTCESGEVINQPGETWPAIDQALKNGFRGLTSGSSVARLLDLHGRKRNQQALTFLTEKQIVGWIKSHKAATGKWPNGGSGAVLDSPEENWGAIEKALADGFRNVGPGLSIAKLRQKYKLGILPSKFRKEISEEIIVEWAKETFAKTGKYPTVNSGPVLGHRGENWTAINAALMKGTRNLPGGTTLAALLAKHGLKRNRMAPPDLTRETIIDWSRNEYDKTGIWPTSNSGPVVGQPGEHWQSIDRAMRDGKRGLKPGNLTEVLRASRSY